MMTTRQGREEEEEMQKDAVGGDGSRDQEEPEPDRMKPSVGSNVLNRDSNAARAGSHGAAEAAHVLPRLRTLTH